MQQNLKSISLHLLFWVTMFAVPYLFFSNPTKPIQFLDEPPPFKFILFAAPLVISVFYLNAHVFVPLFLIKRKFLHFAIAIVSTIVIASFLINIGIETFVPELSFLPRAVFPFIIVLISSTAFRLFIDGNEKEKRLQTFENEQLSTELKLLRAQINPHFLFNTLNSLYTLSLKKSEQTPDAIMQLSNMMRYVTTEAHQEVVPLEKELLYLRNFIALQELRLPKNVTVNTQFLGQSENIQIAPLLLIPFIENAFKYGVSVREDTNINILIKCDAKELFLKVENQKFQSQNEHKDKSGIGLENTKQRLELIYANRYTLIINDLEDKYKVELKISF
jgi:sensor histidine kinase YesM